MKLEEINEKDMILDGHFPTSYRILCVTFR